jgi:hypothetical protein
MAALAVVFMPSSAACTEPKSVAVTLVTLLVFPLFVRVAVLVFPLLLTTDVLPLAVLVLLLFDSAFNVLLLVVLLTTAEAPAPPSAIAPFDATLRASVDVVLLVSCVLVSVDCWLLVEPPPPPPFAIVIGKPARSSLICSGRKIILNSFSW